MSAGVPAPPLTAEQRQQRANLAVLARRRPPDDPELLAARRAFGARRWVDQAERLLTLAPPLPDETRSRLAELLDAIPRAVPA